MDLSITQETYQYLANQLKGIFNVKSIREPIESPPIQTNNTDTESDSSHLLLNFSGGLDSLSLICCLPSSTRLVSIAFEGMEQESRYFSKYPVYCIRTNARRKLSLDTNGAEFMLFGSILYKCFLSGKYTTFGTVLEAGNQFTLLKRCEKTINPNMGGLELLFLSNALTEFGTMMIVSKYMPVEIIESLGLIALPGSEKLYRKECLSNIASDLLGNDRKITQYHYPRKKQQFGKYFASDFLSFCIAKHLGLSSVLAIYSELPPGYEDFVNRHSFHFYNKIRQDILSEEPESIIRYYTEKLLEAGLSFYSEDDYRESMEVKEYLEGIYCIAPSKNVTEIGFQLKHEILANKHHVILYGAGKVGQDYYKQMIDYDIKVWWIDEKYQYYRGLGYDVHEVVPFPDMDYDAVIIATVKEQYEREMRHMLIEAGIPDDKIISAL